MTKEPSKLLLSSRGHDGLLRLSLTGQLSDELSSARRLRLLKEVLSLVRPAPLHVVISANERGDWSWAARWQAALAATRSERVYVFHSLGDRHDGR
jgi:hypothetical protein